jgi:hypothetical protein
MSSLRRVATDAFARGAAICNLDSEQLKVAHAVLVDGRAQAALAREREVTRQYINQIVQSMRKAIAQATPAPSGWIIGTVVLPPKDWPAVRAIEQSARAGLARSGRGRRSS